MKLSSIPLAVAAIAAIIGSTIAAPVALHAIDLGENNAFEREVAVLERKVDSELADYLFTREPTTEHEHEHQDNQWQKDHDDAADACLQAARDCHAAAVDSLEASKHSIGDEVQVWRNKSAQCAHEGILLMGKYTAHKEAAKSPNRTSLHNQAGVDKDGARAWGDWVKQTSAVAKEIQQRLK